MKAVQGKPRQRWVLPGLGSVLVVFMAMPLLGLVAATPLVDFVRGLHHPLVWPALRLSLFTSSLSLCVVVFFGTPLAWTLARTKRPIANAVEVLVRLPAVIPPAVAGVALLLAFGRRGLLAGWAYPRGYSLAFSTSAVIMAEVFVSAPYYVQSATSALRRVDESCIWVARTLGASDLRVFLQIALPLAAPGLIAGAAMSWARALGEFGATLMFAGNAAGVTQTLPLAVYAALEADVRVAQALSIILVVVAFSVLLLIRYATARASTAAPGAH